MSGPHQHPDMRAWLDKHLRDRLAGGAMDLRKAFATLGAWQGPARAAP